MHQGCHEKVFFVFEANPFLSVNHEMDVALHGWVSTSPRFNTVHERALYFNSTFFPPTSWTLRLKRPSEFFFSTHLNPLQKNPLQYHTLSRDGVMDEDLSDGGVEFEVSPTASADRGRHFTPEETELSHELGSGSPIGDMHADR